MNDEIFLRNYKASDLDAMFRLDEACFSEEFRFDRDSMREFAEDRDAVAQVAETVCGEIAGFVIVHLMPVASEMRAYVVTLDVAEQWRRQGLAARLMQATEARAFAAGVRWIQLHVYIGNAGAIRFYERMGYERIRVRRGYYGATELDAIVYGKELHPIL